MTKKKKKTLLQAYEVNSMTYTVNNCKLMAVACRKVCNIFVTTEKDTINNVFFLVDGSFCALISCGLISRKYW